jgi:hypothetical protein
MRELENLVHPKQSGVGVQGTKEKIHRKGLVPVGCGTLVGYLTHLAGITMEGRERRFPPPPIGSLALKEKT